MATADPQMRGGVVMLHDFILLIVAPVIAGIVTELFAHWLDKRDDD
jgi:hypothetical protein